MKSLVFLVEGPSEKALLNGLLPRILPDDIQVQIMVFEGKQDLEKNLVRRIRLWQIPNSAFIVLRDQDAADCRDVKKSLTDLLAQTGKDRALVRIACHELESWYLGDLSAVETALECSGLSRLQNSARYRDPDQTVNPSRELSRITKSSYQKLSGSRSIGPHLDLKNNRSRSFQVFIAGIQRLVAQL